MARIGWRAVVRFPVGRIALELLTLVCLRLPPDVATAVVISSQLTRVGSCLFHLRWPFGVLLFSNDFLLPGKRSNQGLGHPCFLDDPRSSRPSRGP